jgi:hypothetical protein
MKAYEYVSWAEEKELTRPGSGHRTRIAAYGMSIASAQIVLANVSAISPPESARSMDAPHYHHARRTVAFLWASLSHDSRHSTQQAAGIRTFTL